LAPKGTAVIVGGEDGGNLTGGMDRQLRALTMSLFVGQRLTGFLCKERAGDLERLAELVAAGTLTPHIDRTYPLAEVPDAMRRLATGLAQGKIAITI
jgi:NADPH:quinone reductase-like Zn-dependent oxidoreductase